jgi:hypothetical protein
MALNPTYNYLKSQDSHIVLCFSDSVATSSKYLKGAGGIADDGYPMPYEGKILAISVYDGSEVRHQTGEVDFSANDRLSVYAEYDVGEFAVYVRKDGINTAISAGGVSPATDLLVTVTCKITEIP